ncbi:MAG: hypothetical protein ICV66_06360 [Chitinophagaceae bacterium]|nr:hypothetical protein [Chitinophagaceae bacterium]
MKRSFSVLLISFVTLFVCASHSLSQDLTGIWKGYFITETGDHYRLEFQIQQNKLMAAGGASHSDSGVSYSYLDTRFYGKATMTGNYLKSNNVFQIQELKTVEVRNLGGGGTCLMNYRFTYSKSGNEEFLEGTYLGKTENRLDPRKNGVWGDCGGGKVFLRRVTTSDFYVEPFLRNPATQTPTKTITKTQANKPPASNTTKTTTAKSSQTTTNKKSQPVAKTTNKISIKTPQKKETVTNTIKRDTARATTQSISKEQPKKITLKPVTIPTQTRSRENNLVQTLTVHNDEITVRLYDNGEIDDDTISVYLDDKVVLSKKRLSASPLTINIKMDVDNAEHVLVMVAENLGRIPPNTSLMIVYDGDKRYEVRITSTEQKNAMVRFRYQPTG